ncbi:MAG: CoA ester lyase, partial [Burkholderiales bacterium]|nr:CoA ester lyase [Burkholderiales bacterium]
MAESLARQARLGPVFDITADCAESARAGDEDAHASRIAALIASPQNHFNRVGVRIHDLTHRSWHSDLEILIRAAGDRIAYVVAPGVSSVAGLQRVVAAVDDVARQCGVRRLIPVHVEVGDHGALCAAPEMAAHPRVDCLVFALSAYAGALAGFLDPAAIESPGEFENPIIAQAKTAIAIAAHASGKTCTHNPFRD